MHWTMHPGSGQLGKALRIEQSAPQPSPASPARPSNGGPTSTGASAGASAHEGGQVGPPSGLPADCPQPSGPSAPAPRAAARSVPMAHGNGEILTALG